MYIFTETWIKDNADSSYIEMRCFYTDIPINSIQLIVVTLVTLWIEGPSRIVATVNSKHFFSYREIILAVRIEG